MIGIMEKNNNVDKVGGRKQEFKNCNKYRHKIGF